MLRFLRRIRRKLIDNGNLKKYSIYAIGEILLVVIGILIALQINNWNEGQKSQKAKKEKYAAIIADLDRDLERQMRLYWVVGWSKVMTYELSGKSMEGMSLEREISFNLLLYTLDYYSYVKDNHQQLTEKINDKDINAKLAQYLYFQNGSDQGLLDFNNLVEELRDYFSVNGVLDLEAATSFDGAYTFDPNIQVVNEAKLRALMNSETFRGHLVMLKTLSERLREKLFGLMKANNEFQVLLAKNIEQPLENNLGIVGSALPDGEDQFVALKLSNEDENTWEIILDLEDGEFRLSREEGQAWGFNWGRDKFQQGKLEPQGAGIAVKKGHYLIQVNLNELTYSLTQKEE